MPVMHHAIILHRRLLDVVLNDGSGSVVIVSCVRLNVQYLLKLPRGIYLLNFGLVQF